MPPLKTDRVGIEKSATRRAWWTTSLLMVAYLLSVLDRTVLSLMVGPIQRDLHISDTQFGLLVGFAFSTLYAISALPVGLLVDRFSRIKILIVGIGIWSLMTAISAFAATFLQLFVARVAVGVGEAVLNPCAYSILSDSFPRNKLARAVAVYMVGSSMGMGLAFLAGGIVIAALSEYAWIYIPLFGTVRGWQLAFLIAGAPGLLVVLLIWLTVAEPVRIRLSQVQGQKSGELWAFVKRRRALLFLHLSAFSLLQLVNLAFITWTPALLQRSHGANVGMAGLILALATGIFGGLGYLSGGGLADLWVKQGRPSPHMRVGLLGSVVALPLALGSALGSNIWTVAICLCGLNFMISLPYTAAMAGLQLVTPPQLRGRITALYMMVVSLIALGSGPLVVALLTDYVFVDKAALPLSLALISIVFVPLALIAFALGQKPFEEALATPLYLSSTGLVEVAPGDLDSA